MDESALASAARSDHGENLAGLHFEIDSVQHVAGVIAVAIAEGDVVKANGARKFAEAFCAGLFADLIFHIHEAEDFGGGADGLLKIVVELGEFSDRIVELENGDDESEKSALLENVVVNLIAAEKQ